MGAVTVNMVSADLSHEETILQIADALDTLDQVSLFLTYNIGRIFGNHYLVNCNVNVNLSNLFS